MKRFLGAMLILVFLLSATACGGGRTSGTETILLEDMGRAVSIDYGSKTITDGSDVYRYQISGDYCIITYPNDAEYWIHDVYNLGTEGYDPERYIPGNVLAGLLEQQRITGKNADSAIRLMETLVCLAVIGIGVWGVHTPEKALWLRTGWLYKDAEPTDFGLTMGRIGGFVTIILGLTALLLVLLG